MNAKRLKRLVKEEYGKLLLEYKQYNIPKMKKDFIEEDDKGNRWRHSLSSPINPQTDEEYNVWAVEGPDGKMKTMTNSQFNKWYQKNNGKIPAGTKVGREYVYDSTHPSSRYGPAQFFEDVTRLFAPAEEEVESDEDVEFDVDREPPIDTDSLRLDSDAEEAAPAEGEKYEDDGVIAFEPEEIVVARPPARRSTFDPTAPTAAEKAAQMSMPSEHLPGSGMSYQTPAQSEDLYEAINPARSFTAVKRILKEQGLYSREPTGEEMVEFLVSHGLREDVALAVVENMAVRDAQKLLKRFRR